jgi:5-methylcytosine-specific restriction enzyme subunit McrC
VTRSAEIGLVELSEWDEYFIPNIALTPADRRLATQLLPARRLLLDELQTGLRIRSQSWVGLVRFENFDVRIVPKLTHGNARLVQMLALTGGITAAWQNDALRTLHAERVPDLLDLLSILLVRACERLLAGGVLHDYIEREEAIGVVRGRFLADRQWRKRFGQFHVLECRFDEHDSEIDENRLVGFALGACRTLLRENDLRRLVLVLHERFASICSCEAIDPRELRNRLCYNRLNAHYRGAHELCWLILDAMGIADLLQVGAVWSNVFLIDMNSLFERFVQKLLEFSVGSSYQVTYQKKSRSVLWDLERNRPYSAVIPDFELTGSGGRLIIDAKYKPGRKLNNSDIYQCFLYAQAFNDAPQLPSKAMLVVPAVQDTLEHSRLEVRSIQGDRKSVLHQVGIPLTGIVDEMLGHAPGPLSLKFAATVSTAAHS